MNDLFGISVVITLGSTILTNSTQNQNPSRPFIFLNKNYTSMKHLVIDTNSNLFLRRKLTEKHFSEDYLQLPLKMQSANKRSIQGTSSLAGGLHGKFAMATSGWFSD